MATRLHRSPFARRRYSSMTVRRRSRRVRRNPSRPPSMTPAMRAKIGRAIRAAHRRGVYGKKRSTSRAVARRTTVRHMSAPRRRRRVTVISTRPVRRRSFRRARRGGFGGFGGGGRGGIIGQLFSTETLSVAGGAVGASFITTWVLGQFGRQLPMLGTPVGGVLYKLAIPAAASMLVRRWNKNVANGILIGGVIMAVNDLMARAMAPAAAPTAAVRGMGQVYDPYAQGDELDGMGGEADLATQTYMDDSDELGEYFEAAEFATDPLYSSPSAFKQTWGGA